MLGPNPGLRCPYHGVFVIHSRQLNDYLISFRQFDGPLRDITREQIERANKPRKAVGNKAKAIRHDQTGQVYPSIHAAARELELDHSSISSQLRGQRPTAGKGYTFTRLTELDNG